MFNNTTDRDLDSIRGQLAEIIVLLRALTEQQQQTPPAATRRKAK
tara:strand:+ start:701 stop:835 length:135 start_codon:yes stop_codon:yes gene_type:complete